MQISGCTLVSPFSPLSFSDRLALYRSAWDDFLVDARASRAPPFPLPFHSASSSTLCCWWSALPFIGSSAHTKVWRCQESFIFQIVRSQFDFSALVDGDAAGAQIHTITMKNESSSDQIPDREPVASISSSSPSSTLAASYFAAAHDYSETHKVNASTWPDSETTLTSVAESFIIIGRRRRRRSAKCRRAELQGGPAINSQSPLDVDVVSSQGRSNAAAAPSS